jgi:hypothetical protein
MDYAALNLLRPRECPVAPQRLHHSQLRHFEGLMQALLVLSIAVLVAVAPPSNAQQQKASQMKNSAPADEYFGRMKLSYLGINNTFRDEAAQAGDHTTRDAVINKVGFAEEALRAWQKKYPKDPQLPRSIFLGSRVYLKIWTTPGQQLAASDLIELRDKYATTYFGKQAKLELQKGFTMHIAAVAQPCAPDHQPVPMRTPAPLPTPAPKYNIKVSVIPVPCLTPTPEPTPAPSPAPTMAIPPASSGPHATPIVSAEPSVATPPASVPLQNR